MKFKDGNVIHAKFCPRNVHASADPADRGSADRGRQSIHERKSDPRRPLLE